MKRFPILFALFFVFSLSGSTETAPFSVNVQVEEGENVVGWEKGIFGDAKNEDEKNKKEKKETKDKKDVKKEQRSEKDSEKPKVSQTSAQDSETADDSQKIEVPDADNEESYSKNDPKWGRFYGESPEIKEDYKADPVKKVKHEDAPKNEVAITKEDEEFIPVDILLWSQGGTEYLAMINTGVRVSYLNMYSTLSIGTDFSDSIERPMSLGFNLGGYYRIHDFLITADLGYEKIWDFGDNPQINDYALGLKAGLSYNIWSWVSISAGAGVNYNVLKDATFTKGRFSPMFFGGFEFNLIK